MAPIGIGSIPAPVEGLSCAIVAPLFEGVLVVIVESTSVVGNQDFVFESIMATDPMVSRVFMSPKATANPSLPLLVFPFDNRLSLYGY